MSEVLTLAQYAEHLAAAGKRLHPEASKVLNRGVKQIRDDWRKKAAADNPVHAKKYASTIAVNWAKVVGGTLTASVEPRLGVSAKFGTILELGGPHNAPQRNHEKALEAEAPNVIEWLGKVAGECLRS